MSDGTGHDVSKVDGTGRDMIDFPEILTGISICLLYTSDAADD